MNDYISRKTAIDEFDGVKVDEENCTEYDIGYNDGIDLAVSILSVLPSADVQILSSLLEELTHKERTDRYHVWTTHEVKQWIADKITEMKNDG